jgi:hypothetical protein
MNIDNKITSDRIKKAFSTKVIVLTLIFVLLASTVFYVTVQNREKRELLIWHVTTNVESIFSNEAIRLANEYGAQNGIDKILLTKRHPEDRYFDVAMSTTAYYSCDVFIMDEETAKRYIETDMFLSIDKDRFASLTMLEINSKAIGILVNENEYLFINKKTDIDKQIIYDIIDILLGN